VSAKLLVLDIETYYDPAYSLKKMTIPEYVHDDRFHAHGLAIRYPDGKAAFRPDMAAAVAELQETYGPELEAVTVVLHNSYFDLYVLAHRFGLHVRHFVDTMLLSYHVHGRRSKSGGQDASLKALADRYCLPAKGDLDFMCGVRNPTPQQAARLRDYAIGDVNITYELALRLLPGVTRPEVELPIMTHTVRLFVERSIRVDAPAVEPLRNKVEQAVSGWFRKAAVLPEEVSKNTRFTKLLKEALARTGRELPLKQGKKDLIPATAKKDPAMLAMLHDGDPVVEALANARVGKKSQDQILARLDTIERITAATGGSLPVHLIYYGAHTGRFTGGGGHNCQNLGRSDLGGQVRGLLVPDPGHVFIIGDFAQIEARITAWLANDQTLLEGFRQGRDLYAEEAAGVFGCPVRKPTDLDPPDVKAFMASRRQVGKTMVLGLGFGMGALRFMNSMRMDRHAAKLFLDRTMTPEKCAAIVRRFRSCHPAILRLWRTLEDAFWNAILGHGRSVAGLRFERRNTEVLVWLPSGRALRYPGARIEDVHRTMPYLDQNGHEAEFERDGPAIVYGRETDLYGGKITENVVQAAARDILVEAILKLEAMGWSVVLHVHDEVVVAAPEADAERAKSEVERVLNTTPAWAAGLPVSSELKVETRYTK